MYIRRKVFSNVEQPEEQLYSVTMTEEEYDLFSEFLEEYLYTDKDDVAAATAAGIGAATALGATGYGVHVANKELAKEGGLKGVFKANKGAKAAAKAADAAQAKIDKKAVAEAMKYRKQANGLTGKAYNQAKAEATELRAKMRANALQEKLAEANKNTKEALKKGLKAAKSNKKVVAGLAAGGALAAGAGVYAAGHHRK